MSVEIKVGQIWRERDNRLCRKVEVVGFCEETGKVKIMSTNGFSGFRTTKAKRERFGKSGGYELIKDVDR